jgi:hypothetical protein
MIKNRPALSTLPKVNNSVMGQQLGFKAGISAGLFGFAAILIYKIYLNNFSLELYKTKKQFAFESDPYSGKVRCSYTEVPNRQHGF